MSPCLTSRSASTPPISSFTARPTQSTPSISWGRTSAVSTPRTAAGPPIPASWGKRSLSVKAWSISNRFSPNSIALATREPLLSSAKRQARSRLKMSDKKNSIWKIFSGKSLHRLTPPTALPERERGPMNRRQFLHAGSAATSGLLLLKPSTAFGYQANSSVRLGLLGCGSRGTAVATSFSQNTTAQVVALADLFPDQLAAGRSHFDELNANLGRQPIGSNLLFHGPHAFEQLAASPDIDLIQISTPPFFHVQHLEAAVASGKHVYCEKPIGVDVAQAKQALEIAKKVKTTQSVDVGFQCRNAPPIAAIAEKIKAVALGKIGSISAYYFAPASKEKVRAGAGPDEYRLRNWLWDRAL